jgi:nucleosome assembly protein 1-like 1
MSGENAKDGVAVNEAAKSLQDALRRGLGDAEERQRHGPSHSSDILSSLPKSVLRRIKALKKLQLQSVNIESDFYKEVHALECRYWEKFQGVYKQRSKITNGEHEPTDDECDFPLSEDEQLAEQMNTNANLNGERGADKGDDVKGIPSFWLNALKNTEITFDMIQEHDEPILEHLTDIECHLFNDPMKFQLSFHFSPNDHFTNSVLTKEYTLSCTPDKDDPFDFEGPEIIACKGCAIDWKPNKNVTVKLMKKKQKHKTKAQTRFVTKQVKAESFFNFFSPPEANPENPDEEMDEETKEFLNADFEVGQTLRDRIIPRAVLFFTGEAVLDDDFEMEDDDDMDDEDAEDEDEEDDGDN